MKNLLARIKKSVSKAPDFLAYVSNRRKYHIIMPRSKVGGMDGGVNRLIRNEIIAWLDDNMPGRWQFFDPDEGETFIPYGDDGILNSKNDRVFFDFMYEEDLLMFKLMWGGS